MKHSSVLPIGLLAAIFSAPLGNAQRYTITNLGALPSHGSSAASGINASGQVVGVSGISECRPGGRCGRAFLWIPEPAYGLPAGMNDLGIDVLSVAAINSSGSIVGSMGSPPTGFLWTEGVIRPLLPPDGGQAWANDINDSGSVVGTYTGDPDWTLPFLFSGDQFYRLEVSLGWGDAEALGINEGGVVVGSICTQWGCDYRGTSKAVYWIGGGIGFLDSLDHTNARAFGINDLLTAVGSVGSYPTYSAAVRWTGLGAPQSLGGRVGYARAINNLGQVAAGAFLWEEGGEIIDLHGLIPPDSGWSLLSASAINDAGQIVGDGVIDGQTRAFLLTPVILP